MRLSPDDHRQWVAIEQAEREARRRARQDWVVVRFLTSVNIPAAPAVGWLHGASFARGEVAGFPPALADLLVRQGHAEPYDPAPAGPAGGPETEVAR